MAGDLEGRRRNLNEVRAQNLAGTGWGGGLETPKNFKSGYTMDMAEIRARHLPNTRTQHYRYSNPPQSTVQQCTLFFFEIHKKSVLRDIGDQSQTLIKSIFTLHLILLTAHILKMPLMRSGIHMCLNKALKNQLSTTEF
jgi:hypothetical protein